MPDYPDAAILYPEVAALGSLAAALRHAATGHDLSIAVETATSGPMFRAVVPARVPHRKPLVISASRVERRWSIRGCDSDQDLALIEGGTSDLNQVTQAAQTWTDGQPLSRIAELTPFVELTGRFEVPDRDPARMVESEWQHLRTEAAGLNWPEYTALIDAAYGNPRLRRLYPFTSHWILRFSTRTRPNLSHDILACIHPGHGQDYAVTMGWSGPELGTAATAGDAVSIAVRHLPSAVNSVTYGAYQAG